MNTPAYILIELTAWLILVYKLNYTYWFKWLFIRPFCKTRAWWIHISCKTTKPFDCYGCMVLWTSCIVAYVVEPHTFESMAVHISGAYLPAVLIQTHIEK